MLTVLPACQVLAQKASRIDDSCGHYAVHSCGHKPPENGYLIDSGGGGGILRRLLGECVVFSSAEIRF